ncbi:MAG: CoA transferase [Actinomycetota bacterium]|jgi:crotonobetainyl-CoA:carnitine CoA-transferase CaiB-like acyl-CoA transferase|nr:CoA transferase [Actinomycetota bacterium]MEC9473857.1 CoA transferase [Actinomycetota bacterium]
MLLENVRVLDFTQYLSGPSATRMLAELGADVIKVEYGPTGDPSRSLPFTSDEGSSYYTQQNRGKRSLCIDLSKDEGCALARDIALRCDLVVENFGPGVLERRSLDWENLRLGNPKLIMASISAFGKTGPLSHLQGFDLMGQALSGMMHLTGEPDGAPQFTGSPISDCAAGLTLFGAIGHALFHRERTGEGQYIEVTLVDPLFSMHSIAVQGHSATRGEWAQERSGRQFSIVVPSGTYQGPDGWVVLQVLEPQWERLCEAMDQKALATDARFGSPEARVENAQELLRLVEVWMQEFDSNAELLSYLEGWRIPAAPVLSPQEAMVHPHFTERGMVRTVQDPHFGEITVTGLPARFSASDPPDREPPAPTLGEHTREILEELLDLSQDQIELLQEEGVVVSQT